MYFLKLNIIGITLFIASLLFLIIIISSGVANAAANNLDVICSDGKAKNSALCKGYSDGSTNQDADSSIIAKAVSALSYVVGILSVIMIMYGGFSLIIGGKSGKENSVRTGKGIITWALVGLAIAALAQIMVLFVIGKL